MIKSRGILALVDIETSYARYLEFGQLRLHLSKEFKYHLVFYNSDRDESYIINFCIERDKTGQDQFFYSCVLNEYKYQQTKIVDRHYSSGTDLIPIQFLIEKCLLLFIDKTKLVFLSVKSTKPGSYLNPNLYISPRYNKEIQQIRDQDPREDLVSPLEIT